MSLDTRFFQLHSAWWARLLSLVVAPMFVLATAGVAVAQDDDGDNDQPAGAENGEPDNGAVADAPAADTGATTTATPPDGERPASDHDRVILENQEVHDGRITGLRGGKLVLRSRSLGADILIPQDKLSRAWLHESRPMFVRERKDTDSREITLTSDAQGKLVWTEAGQAESSELDFGWYMMRDERIPDAEWNGSLLGTLTVNRGNTNDVNAGFIAQISRTSHFDLLRFEYEFGYGEVSSSAFTFVSRRFHRGLVEYRLFLSDVFGLFARNEIRSDLLAGIQFRDVLDIGATFVATKSDDLALSFDLSVNFTYEDRSGLEDIGYFGGRAAMYYFLRIAETITLDLFADISINFREIERWLSTIRATIANDFGQGFTLGVILENNYDNRPLAGLKNNDFRVVLNFGWVFKFAE